MPKGYTIKPAVCLDLDKTVRYNRNDPDGFINEPREVAIYDDVEKKLWQYRDRGYIIAGVTNQGGVAFHDIEKATRGNARRSIKRMVALFEKNPFHTIKVSFCHPDGDVEPFNVRSLGRKPDYGMLYEVELEMQYDKKVIIDWDRSIVVGDRKEDYQCAKNAGVCFVHATNFFGRGYVENVPPFTELEEPV